MKFGLIVVIALVVSAFAAHFLLQDPGYVVINFRSYLIEMSVPVLLAIIFLIIIGVWLMVKVFRAPKKLGQAAGRYRSGRAGQRLTKGIIQLAEGNFAKGEKLLVSAAKVSDAPLLNYLAAARAAHLQGNDERRDNWLKQAYEDLPEAGNAVLLTQAELQLDRAQFEQALATLRRIEENTPNHSHALALLGRLYFQLEDWNHLSEIIPRLRKRGRVDSATLDQWSRRVYIERLNNSGDGDAVLAEWKLVPKELKKDLSVLEAYYEGLMRTAMHDKAEKDLAAEIRKEWRGSLVRIFGLVEGADPTKQLRRAENWLKNHGEDADLLLTSARLCLRNELWGKARSYLETVISIRPTPEAYQEYGRLLNRLGEGDAAADAYRAGLGMVAKSPMPAIPDLRPD
jgi:HemY protein